MKVKISFFSKIMEVFFPVFSPCEGLYPYPAGKLNFNLTYPKINIKTRNSPPLFSKKSEIRGGGELGFGCSTSRTRDCTKLIADIVKRT